MPAQTINTFLYVATHDGCFEKDLTDVLGMGQSTVSRNVATLRRSTVTTSEAELVRSTEDPYERRRKILTQTPRGRQLKDRLIELTSQG